MRVFCIVDCKGNPISAWATIGKAKTMCRIEFEDHVVPGTLTWKCKAKPKPKKKARKR